MYPKSHFQAEKDTDIANLCRNTVNIVVVYRSEKYLSELELVSKHSYKRKAAIMPFREGQLSLAS